LDSHVTHLNVGEPVPRPELATARQITYAQSKLAALGYDPGPADGQLGSRTEAAIRKFQKDARLLGDGRIDDRLLARLDTEVRARAPSRPRELVAISPGAPKTEKPRERSVFGSVLGGFQRLLGRDFDGVRRPGELAAYCRANSDTWIYDFGREASVYCGNVVAGQVK
jgi:peptidoglycan hydrolase-like protein with peptidoglycan-binding domain